MTDELFTTEETLSPRLRWMREHHVMTHFNPDCDPAWIAIRPMLPEHRGHPISEIMADACALYDDNGWIGEGNGECDAIADLARKLGLKLWHEQ